MSSMLLGRRVVASALSRGGLIGQQHVRGMATEKELKKRLKSVASIMKITKASKMVASAKLRGVQNLLMIGRRFASPVVNIWKTEADFAEEAKLAEARRADSKYELSAKLEKKGLVVAVTTDRGLCGGVNSAVVRVVRRILTSNAESEANILVLGERGRSSLTRTSANLFTMALVDISKQVQPSFDQALSVASFYLQHEFDDSAIVWNHFKSAIAYETMVSKMISPSKRKADLGVFALYEFEGEEEETVQNLIEFTVATSFYHIFLENNTTEQSQKMAAMENSTKNASELIESLRIMYNRSRQARITTELTEIISGAAALE